MSWKYLSSPPYPNITGMPQEAAGRTPRAVAEFHPSPPAVTTSFPTMRTKKDAQFFVMATLGPLWQSGTCTRHQKGWLAR